MGDELVGKFFHTTRGSKIHWQGQVLERTSEGRYLIQLYEWMFGNPTIQKLVTEEQLSEWIFYDTPDDWVEAGDKASKEQ